MKVTEFTTWFFQQVGWTLHVYPWHLLGCLVLWATLCLLTPANRASAFIFSFSAWFSLCWSLSYLSLLLALPNLALTPLALVMGALTAGLFGVCTVWSFSTLGLPSDVEADASRFIRLGWILLFAHVFHLLFTAIAESAL
jgi:hypothetical protein